jgi:hypothetical protein
MAIVLLKSGGFISGDFPETTLSQGTKIVPKNKGIKISRV